MKLLIVDSDRDLVEMLTTWLKTLGFDVHRAYTGERAKIVWEEQRPDIVILDPILKDVDAMKMCRDMQNKHDALVLVMTEKMYKMRFIAWSQVPMIICVNPFFLTNF